MATDQAFIEFLVDQMSDAGRITFRKIFGEYAIYCDDKVVALVCDNQLCVESTEKGREYIGDVVESPPYPGGKPYYLIEDKFDDREWISELIRITAQEVAST
jgi:TfoX/Sxy family transcriptional regulator of competence genes